MTQTVTINGVNRTLVAREESAELVTYAYVGEIGMGKVILDDTAGTIVVPSWKDIAVAQSATTPSTFYKGFTHSKRIRRGKSARTLARREYEIATQDGNDLLRRLVIRETKKRPAESVNARIGWLLEDELSRVGVASYGRVESSTVLLDADKSVKGRYPIDILGPIAKAIGFNFYVRWNADQGGWELVFRNDNESEDDTCTLSISNVASEIDGVSVFEPLKDAELTQDAEHVYSGAYSAHDKGNVYETRDSTATAFTERDGITEDMSIRKDSTARRDARRFLRESDTEEQLLAPILIRVPESHVGLVQAGMRISTRMTHMAQEGWDPAIYARIIRLRVGQYTDGDYSLSMDLSPPEAGSGGGVCPYEATPEGFYGPLGDDPDEDWGSHAAPSDGVVYYLRPGIFYPTSPTPGAESLWHFPTYGYLGIGDSFASGFQNEVRFILVGDGTAVVTTSQWEGQAQPFTIGINAVDANGVETQIDVVSGTAGEDPEIELADSCYHILRLRADARNDAAYIGMVFTGLDWTPA